MFRCEMLAALWLAQATLLPPPSLPVAEDRGAWVVEVTRVEGMGLRRTTAVMSSKGEARCGPSHDACEPPNVTNTVRSIDAIVQALAEEDGGGAATEPSSDLARFCRDCPVITVTVARREPDGLIWTGHYKWMVLGSSDRADPPRRVHSLIEPLLR